MIKKAKGDSPIEAVFVVSLPFTSKPPSPIFSREDRKDVMADFLPCSNDRR